MPAVGAMTWQILAFKPRAKHNLEVALTGRVGAFSGREALFVWLNRHRDAVANAPKMVHQACSPMIRSVVFTCSLPEMSFSGSVLQRVASWTMDSMNELMAPDQAPQQ